MTIDVPRFIRLSALFCALAVMTVSAWGQCPSISVIGPSGISRPGDTITFRVEVGAVGPRLQYSWSITAGTSKDGQGSTTLTVATESSMSGTELVAKVKVEGLPAGCETTASETAPVQPPPSWCWDMDSYSEGLLTPGEKRGRLDTFFADLTNNPTHIGLFVLRVTAKERRDQGNPRIQFILSHSRFRKFDRTRFLFALERADFARTILVRIPPDGEMPPCNECLMIKGVDIQ